LGNGTTSNLKTPTQITAASDWAAISAGDFHNLALKTDGTLWAWGDNAKGQLGDGSTTGRLVPTQIVTGYPGNFDKLWVAVASGGSHSLALHADGTLWAWGDNGSGQAGGPVFGSNITKPRQVAKLSGLLTNIWNSNWVAIAAGLNHSLALQADGTLWAWGNNKNGQIGDGTTVNRNIPVQVGNATNWVSAAAGDTYSVARRADGTLWSWGNNTRGQLGTGAINPTDVPLNPQPHSAPVQELSHASDWLAAGIGSRHVVAPKASGSLWAWGDNSKGELGDSSTVVRNSPAPLAEGQIDVIPAVDFNTVAIGNIPVQSISISNTGTGPLTVNSLTLGGTDSAMFGVATGVCGIAPFTVKTGGTCTIVASFNPATAGTKNASLTINSSDPLSQMLTVALSGTAVVPLNVVTSVSPAGSGTISPHGTNGTVLVVPGTGQQFYIAQNTGYHLVDVAVNGTSKGAVQSVILSSVTANATISASFVLNTYTITMNAGPHGTISGPATVTHGDSPFFNITPDTGYHIVDVKVDGVSKGAAATVSLPSVISGATITATFAINTYNITMNAGSNGTISGPATANYGDSPSYTITPNSGYHVVDVKVDGVSKGAVTSLTLPTITSDKAITAQLAANDHTIAASADVKGTIAPSGNVSVPNGANQTFTFTPKTGYNIVNVIIDGVSMGPIPSYTFSNVTSEGHTVKAVFIPDGDVDNNGKVDIVDALLTLKVAVSLVAPDAAFKLHGDVAPLGADGLPAPDNHITVADALLILRKAVGVTSGW
jgi:hypothetical protein